MSVTQTIKGEEPATQGIFQRTSEVVTSFLEGNKKKNTVKVLDSVRAIAILSVVIFHIASIADLKQAHWIDRTVIAIIFAGNAGVTLFLVLSGFLLSLPYIKSLLFDGEWPSVRQFYLRRALRIFPGYYLALFLLIVLSQPMYMQPSNFKELFLFLTFFMDSSKNTWQQLNGPFWTLAVEWQFYMLLPWLALAVRPLVQRGSLTRRLWVLASCLGALVVWGMASRYGGGYLATRHPEQTFGLPYSIFRIVMAVPYGCCGIGGHGKYLEDFAIGIFTAVCYMMARNGGPEGKWALVLRRLSPWLLIGSLLWLLGMALWNATFYDNVRIFFPIVKDLFFHALFFEAVHEVGLAIGYGSFVLAILFAGPFITRLFEWSPLRWIGLISYSIYIWHNPLLISLSNALKPVTQDWSNVRVFELMIVWFALGIIPFSLTIFVLVERPFIKFSERLRKKSLSTKKESIEDREITLKRETVAIK